MLHANSIYNIKKDSIIFSLELEFIIAGCILFYELEKGSVCQCDIDNAVLQY